MLANGKRENPTAACCHDNAGKPSLNIYKIVRVRARALEGQAHGLSLKQI